MSERFDSNVLPLSNVIYVKIFLVPDNFLDLNIGKTNPFWNIRVFYFQEILAFEWSTFSIFPHKNGFPAKNV